MEWLNLGVLAHVDAGKTTLTERLLYEAGAIDEFGSVDAGTTQTDTLALERRRGITIKSAVASFTVGDLGVNLVDTPGHPDFIAEVERALRVLDGAVLVVSAVEGVQPQTRTILRALRRLAVPTVLFVNKIDRMGASYEGTLRSIGARLTGTAIAMDTVGGLGSRDATAVPRWDRDPGFHDELLAVLGEHDDEALAAFLGGVRWGRARLRATLARQVASGDVQPVFFGAAATGAGVASLMAGVGSLLPHAANDVDAPFSGRVFKVERRATGERLAYVRVRHGTLRVRDRVLAGTGAPQTVTGVEVFGSGGPVRRATASAGEIARVAGLSAALVGDDVGAVEDGAATFRFAPPALEAVVEPLDRGQGPSLRRALAELAEQDPLIDVRLSEDGSLCVSLYGEVQREVIAETLSLEYGVAVAFREATTRCVERPRGAGSAVQRLQDPSNPISATVGLRVEPASLGAGVRFHLAIDPRVVPIHIFTTRASFIESMTGHVRGALSAGLHGWPVVDCDVTMTECDHYVGDGRVPPGTTSTTAGDFKRLTPVVLRAALVDAGTLVCEPLLRVRIEAPASALRAVAALVAQQGSDVGATASLGDLGVVEATVRASRIQDLRRRLPGATSGEGSLESTFLGYAEVSAGSVRRGHTRAR